MSLLFAQDPAEQLDAYILLCFLPGSSVPITSQISRLLFVPGKVTKEEVGTWAAVTSGTFVTFHIAHGELKAMQ